MTELTNPDQVNVYWESFGEDRYRSTESWDVDVVDNDAALGPTVDLS